MTPAAPARATAPQVAMARPSAVPPPIPQRVTLATAAVASPMPAPVATAAEEPEEDWEWTLAVARARAVAEDVIVRPAARPATGDHRSAAGAFTKAQLAEQDENWADAMYWYGQASNLDPGWFEAHYNEAVLAQRIRNFSHALTAYEWALAIQPGAVDARYNFALALKAAGHPTDAVNELKKIVAANPSEARAHLALGNLYAQALHDPVQAKREYAKLLELDPENPQATGVRAWLNSN
jgi:tetratricopeptide (TPR) repeat protein